MLRIGGGKEDSNRYRNFIDNIFDSKESNTSISLIRRGVIIKVGIVKNVGDISRVVLNIVVLLDTL